MVDLEDRVFLDDAEEDQDAQGGVEVERAAGQVEGEQREGNGEREGEQDGQGMDHALVIHGQDDVHEDDGEEEGPEEFDERALEFLGLTGDGEGIGGGHVQRGGGVF